MKMTFKSMRKLLACTKNVKKQFGKLKITNKHMVKKTGQK